MFKQIARINTKENKLYNKILSLSRNKLLYTKLDLKDIFSNRINLIFLHTSFLFVKKKFDINNNAYNRLYQKLFDLTFNKIELNLREIGYGDVSINKNMKSLVKIFYDILLNCENYNKKTIDKKKQFLLRYIELNKHKKSYYYGIVDYFDKYHVFCLDLSPDNVLNGVLNFEYKL